MSIPKNNKSVKYLKENIVRFLDKAAGTNRSEIQGWISSNKMIDKFHVNIKKEQEVCTLLSPENAKLISSFFYSPKVSCSKNKLIGLDEIININGKNGVLINGRLGQGKSVLLKYLQFLELNTGCSLPIFIELRKMKSHTQILEYACNKINEFGLSCSNKLFLFLLSEGRISLFLDGFDEVSLEYRDAFNQELSVICTKYPQAKLIVTSRFNTEITRNPNFKNYSISLLSKSDHAPFIKKILSVEEVYTPIISKIKESREFDFDVLDTPLLLTWFIIVYNKRFKIPKTKLGFYEDLFGAILSRHDGLKDSHNRASKSRLADDEIKKVFCAFCYLTRKDEKSFFTDVEVLAYIRKALNVSDFKETDQRNYLYDLTHVTCLLKEDGFDYEFIHESIAHYFSACFINFTTDDNAKEFYTNRIGDWKKFEGELKFLEAIDSVRYSKFFLIPIITNMVHIEGDYEDVVGSMLESVFSEAYVSLAGDMKTFKAVIMLESFSDDYVVRNVFGSSDRYELEKVAASFVKKFVLSNKVSGAALGPLFGNKDVIRASDNLYLKLMSVLENKSLSLAFYQYVGPVVKEKLSRRLLVAKNIVDNEESKAGLFS